MNILVIGSGGREHALVWKLAQSHSVQKIFCAPGNAGISGIAECVDIAPTDLPSLVTFAKEKRIDLTVVGPESSLAAGVVDIFQEEDLKIFGPTKEAALLESSKAYAKEFCSRHNIPQAAYRICSDSKEAKAVVQNGPFPLVVKDDRLAQGKGVHICQNREEAAEAVEKIAGRIVIEDFLKGEEASFIVFVDGRNILPLASSKDHKKLLEGDKGPNTGGMGAYSPSPLITSSVYEKIMEKIMKPTVQAMREEGHPFVGFLYAGLMINEGEPSLLEFNARLGDPEAQAILPRLRNDLLQILLAALEGKLETIEPSWDTRACACIVMASKGYPEKYETGFSIQGLKEAQELKDVIVFHAGTQLKDGKVVTAGGRVLGVSALGKDVKEALAKAYQASGKISWQGCYYRKDIHYGR